MATITESVDAVDSISTAYTMTVGDTFNGILSDDNDADWVAISLVAGQAYRLGLTPGGANPLPSPQLILRDAGGFEIDNDRRSGAGTASEIVFIPPASGTYYLSTKSGIGDYTFTAVQAADPVIETTDAPRDISTPYTIEVGGLFVGGGVDWVKVTLEEGTRYDFFADPTGNRFADAFYPELQVYDSAGSLINTINRGSSVADHYAAISFVATYSGTFFIEASSGGFDSGTYLLEVKEHDVAPPKPELRDFTIQEIADQLTDGYWDSTGEARQSFDISTDTIISVNLESLTPEGATLALAALKAWENVSGLTFTRTTGTADIKFDDEETGAFAINTLAKANITHSEINIDKSLITSGGSAVDSDAFLTYIHEIGHALGLGHAGNYNTIVTYSTQGDGNNHYLNDSVALSVMSYFTQDDNTSIDNTLARVISPMIADILAIQTLYSTANPQYKQGKTTYDLAGLNTGIQDSGLVWDTNAVAYTIYDTGGVDTFDASAATADQKVNMAAGSLWDIDGGIGNVVIAKGTLIENFKGGRGVDVVTGNIKDNKIKGNGDADILSGLKGNDTLWGGNGWDTLYGGTDADTLSGGKGSDILYGGAQNDLLKGDGNLDVLFGGNNRDTLFGGAHRDTLNGENGNDILRGGGGTDFLFGGEGRDKLAGGGNDDELQGGAGRDIFQFRGNKAEGTDSIVDFTKGEDSIQITGGTTFSDLTITASGTNTEITWDSGTKIVLLDVLATSITEADFTFG